MRYGINESPKHFCKTHQQFYPCAERCPWCPEPIWVSAPYPGADPDCYICGGMGHFYDYVGTRVNCNCGRLCTP